MDAKQYLIEILEFYLYKLKHGGCTMAEIDSVSMALQSNMEIHGTIGEFASFFGKSKDAVNSVIKNKLLAKPKRNVVLYPFHAFLKVIPDSWRKK